MSSQSAIVVGAGIVGLSCAYSLLASGFGVAVYDDSDLPARASFGNAGALSPGSVVPLATPGVLAKVPQMLLSPSGPLFVQPSYALTALPWLLRFVSGARPALVEQTSRALATLHHGAIDAYRPLLDFANAADLLHRTGQLHVYQDETALAKDSASWDMRSRRGVRFERVDRARLAALEPSVSGEYLAGVFLPDEGMIESPATLLRKLTSRLAQAGVLFHQRKVQSIRAGAGGLVRVGSEAGDAEAGTVVVAAGAWSRNLSRQVGSDVPLETQRGYHLMFERSGIPLQRPITAADRKIFVSPLDGRIRVAGTVEFAGLRSPPSKGRADAILRHGRAVIPELKGAPLSSWMGHRPCLPDSLPVIGRSVVLPKVLLAFGHGHLGLTEAARTGAIIGQLARDETPNIDLAPFAATRFAR